MLRVVLLAARAIFAFRLLFLAITPRATTAAVTAERWIPGGFNSAVKYFHRLRDGSTAKLK